MDALSQETIAILGVGVVLAGFFWSLHRDVAILRERISRLEGLFEGLRDTVTSRSVERRFDDRFLAVGGLVRRLAPRCRELSRRSLTRGYSVRTRVSAGRQLTKRRAPRSARTGPRSVLGTVAERRTPSAVTRKRWVSLP